MNTERINKITKYVPFFQADPSPGPRRRDPARCRCMVRLKAGTTTLTAPSRQTVRTLIFQTLKLIQRHNSDPVEYLVILAGSNAANPAGAVATVELIRLSAGDPPPPACLQVRDRTEAFLTIPKGFQTNLANSRCPRCPSL